MDAHPAFGSPSFRLVAKGLIELHRLIKQGKDDSPEGEVLRDALDVPLKALSRPEKELAQWLSEDLYSISDPPQAFAPKEMNPEAQQQLNEALEACQSRDWNRSLALLRKWREYVLPTQLSLFRGSIWSKAGHPSIAAEFYGHAADSNPGDAQSRALYLQALAESDPEAARKAARKVLADDTKYAPIVVAHAASIRFIEARTASGVESTSVYRELVSILERNAMRIEVDQNTSSRVAAYALTVGSLGFCHERLGNVAAAVRYYSSGLQENPNDEGLFVARGILQYGSSPRAITDMERAVKLGSPIVWPYLFLAHHYLATNQFDKCRTTCEAGLQRQGTDTAKSQLEEWRAIAQAELGFPAELVRAAFEAALRLDPSNETSLRNQAAYETSLKALPTSSGFKWEQKTAAAVRQFGIAERQYALAA